MSKSAATVTNKPKCPVSYAFPVLLSCFLMAANAGFVNAIFLESLYGTSVSHLTGMTTRAASQFAIGSYELMLRNLGVIFFYFLGSAVNSFIVGDSQMRMVQNYGFAVMLESALLLVPIFVPTNSRLMINISVYFVAAACGLQNAMLTIYGTAIVRTTHVTGLITDVGILFGLYFRDLIIYRVRRKEGMWKIKIMIPLYLGFFTGAALGMLSLSHIGTPYSMLFPATLTAWIGVGFVVLRYIHKKKEAAHKLQQEMKERAKRREEEEREAQLEQEQGEGELEEDASNFTLEGSQSITNQTTQHHNDHDDHDDHHERDVMIQSERYPEHDDEEEDDEKDSRDDIPLRNFKRGKLPKRSNKEDDQEEMSRLLT